MKKTLITGATGFIGGHLIARLLREGVLVRALVRPTSSVAGLPREVEIVEGDIGDESSLSRAVRGVDTVFHLAGKVHEISELQRDDGGYHSIIVEGTKNLLEACKKNEVKTFIFFSSVKAMGEETKACLDESADPRPVTAYGRSKLEAETLVLDYGRRFGLHTVCLRLPLVYGEGTKGNLMRMIQAIDRGFFPPLGKIRNYRSMVHVTNVTEAALLSLRPQANGACYIVSDGAPYTTHEMYEMILKTLGKKIPHWHIPFWVLKTLSWAGDGIGRLRGRRFLFDSEALTKLTGSAWYSSEKISKDLGYQPSFTFQDALPGMIDWYHKSGS